MKLTPEEMIRMIAISDRVNAWAKDYAQNDFYYGTRYSYYKAAKMAWVIEQDEYDLAERYYGELWTYRGD